MGSHRIELSQRISQAKMSLLAIIIFLLVIIYPCSSAEAAEVSSASLHSESIAATSAIEQTFPVKDLAAEILQFTTSSSFVTDTDDGFAQVLKSSSSVVQQEKSASLGDYISVRGYSASNHLAVALEATVAAVVVVFIGYIAFRVYRRRKNAPGKACSNGKKSAPKLIDDDTEFAKTNH